MRHDSSEGWSRRAFLGGLALAGTAAGLGWRPGIGRASTEPPPETTTLRLRYSDPACWAPFHLAEPLLKEEGFTDVRYISGPTMELPAMFRDGVIDLTPDFSAAGLFQMDRERVPAKFISGLHAGCYALLGSERIHSVRDLKGKTMWTGSSESSGPHIFWSVIASYVGLDPRTDVSYVWAKKDEAIRLFQEGKIDAMISFPPGPQELMAKGIGHVLLDTNVDKPWSQYFCCMVAGQSDFIEKNPIATKRALRAIFKAIDLVARDPELATRALLAKKIVKEADKGYILQTLKDIPYAKWREYNPEDTIRFYALRMKDIGMMKSNPQQFIAQNTDWRFVNELKAEFRMPW
jgi:NitT/TauT family transport system substrate-binding protein